MLIDQGLKPSRVEALALKVLLTDMSRVLDSPPAIATGPAPGKRVELVVAQRPHGLYAILDGNRRAALLRMTHGDLHVVNCQVYEGLTLDQETEIAHALNAPSPLLQDHKPTPRDRFLARLAEGDETALTITRLAGSLGWEISERQISTSIVAVASLERVYHGGDPDGGYANELALWQTLYAVTRAWGHQRDAVNGDLLLGVGLRLLGEDGRVDLDALINRLARFKGGPRGLLSRARTLKSERGGTVAECVAHAISQ